MIIKEIGIRGFKSYGNNEQKIKLNINSGELILLSGANGSGKCVDESTLIDVQIIDFEPNLENLEFLDKTDEGKRIFLYIKKSNKSLYEKIEKFRKGQ